MLDGICNSLIAKFGLIVLPMPRHGTLIPVGKMVSVTSG
jgi:hypothetical protein